MVVAFLLVLYENLHQFDNKNHDIQAKGKPVDKKNFPSLLVGLVRETLASIGDPLTFAKQYGYGIPEWLAEPLHLFLDRFTDPPDEEHWLGLIDLFEREDLHTELFELYEGLKGIRVSPPADFVQTLRDDTFVSKGNVIEAISTAKARDSSSAADGIRIDEVARQATLGRNDRLAECGWRLKRFDFPVIVRGENDRQRSILLGAEIRSFASTKPGISLGIPKQTIDELLGSPQEVLADWHLTSPDFQEAMQRAVESATGLLLRIGLAQYEIEKLRGPEVCLRSVLPPMSIDGASIALPLALEILRRALCLPPSDWVATGDVEYSGKIVSQEKNDISLKLESVKVDGIKRGLLTAAEIKENYEPDESLILLKGSEATLAHAAELFWGDAWTKKIKQRRSQALKPLGFIEGWSDDPHSNCIHIAGSPIRINTKQSRDIVRFFEGLESPSLAFLSGPPFSGKTWIAQEVKNQLETTQEWNVTVISMLPSVEPDAEELIGAIKRSLALTGLDTRNVIIIDNIHWNDKLVDVESRLHDVVKETNASLLAVTTLRDNKTASLNSDENAITEVDNSLTFLPIVGRENLQSFLQDIYDRYPTIEVDKALTGTILENAKGDIWWILNLVALAAEQGGNTSYEELVGNFISSRLEKLQPSQLNDLRMLAAMSMLSVYTPESYLKSVSHRQLTALGARSNRCECWLIPSRSTCQALMQIAYENHELRIVEGVNSAVSSFIIERFLRKSVESEDGSSIVAVLSKLKSYDTLCYHEVIKLTSKILRKWAMESADARHLAEFILVVSGSFGEIELQRVVDRLAKLLFADWKHLRPIDLVPCLRVLRLERMFISDSEFWEELLERLENDGLRNILKKGTTSYTALSIAEELWRMHHDASYHAFAANVDLLLPNKQIYTSIDFKLALRILEIVKRIDQACQTIQTKSALQNSISICIGIAEREFSTDGPIEADQLLGRLALRQKLELDGDDWDQTLEPVVRDVQYSMLSSTVLQICRGLSFIDRVNRLFAIKLLNKCNIVEQLKNRTRNATPGEIATLLGVVGEVHATTAFAILYSTNAIDCISPNKQLALRIAQRIHASGDSKGGSRVLHAANKIDTLYGSVKFGFASLLAEEIGENFLKENLRHDARISVLYHLVRGLLATEVSYLEEIWETICDTVSANVAQSLRPWAPQLALTMCETESVGHEFIQYFTEKVPIDRIVRGMTSTHNIQSLELFHSLAAFYPGASLQFREYYEQRNQDLLQRMSSGHRPEIHLRAIRAVAGTLRRSGMSNSGRKALEQLGRHWDVEMLRHAPAGDASASISILRDIDWKSAASILRLERTKDILEHKTKRMLSEPDLLVQLVTVVERTSRGVGIELLNRIRRNEGGWYQALREIAHDQNPRRQGTTLLQLCRLDERLDEGTCENIYGKVWRNRISTLGSFGAISNLLRVFSAWNEPWGIEAIKLVNLQRLRRRLRQSSRVDLAEVSRLISTFFALGATDAVNEILDELKGIEEIAQKMPFASLPSFLSTLLIVDDDFAAAMAPGVISRLNDVINEGTVRDDVGLWWMVGWAARSCSEALNDTDAIVIKACPPSFQITKEPVVRLWATSCLHKSDWVVAEQERAIDELLIDPSNCRPEQRLQAVVAVSQSSRALGELFDRSGCNWVNPLSKVPPEHVATALGAGLHNEALDCWLRKHISEIQTCLQHSANRGDGFARVARDLADRYQN